jgi:hypothetical protein
MFYPPGFPTFSFADLLLFHTYNVPGEDPFVLHIEQKDPDFFFHHFRRIFNTRELIPCTILSTDLDFNHQNNKKKLSG